MHYYSLRQLRDKVTVTTKKKAEHEKSKLLIVPIIMKPVLRKDFANASTNKEVLRPSVSKFAYASIFNHVLKTEK